MKKIILCLIFVLNVNVNQAKAHFFDASTFAFSGMATIGALELNLVQGILSTSVMLITMDCFAGANTEEIFTDTREYFSDLTSCVLSNSHKLVTNVSGNTVRVVQGTSDGVTKMTKGVEKNAIIEVYQYELMNVIRGDSLEHNEIAGSLIIGLRETAKNNLGMGFALDIEYSSDAQLARTLYIQFEKQK